jgi:predicted small secreted protein
MRRRLLPALVALLAWATAACQVTLTAGVDVNRDGTGRVTAGVGLDDEAVKEVGDLATGLRLDDVRAAGWEVEPPRKEGDGLTWLRASKPFTEPEQVPAILAELNGPGGPFRDFTVTRTKSLTRSKVTFTGTVDLAAGLAGLADPELTAVLGDVDLGLDPDGLRTRFGDRLKVQASVRLPGDMTTNAPAREGGRALWAPELGQTVLLEASSSSFQLDPRLLIAAGAALLLAIALLAVLVRRRRSLIPRTVPGRR